MSDTTTDIMTICDEIADERLRQVERWGQQDHPSIGSEGDRKLFAQRADHWKAINDARVGLECLTWDGILLEEVYEALSEEDDILRREELVQVAAVAAAEIEAIDRRLAAITGDVAEDEDSDADLD